MIWLSLGENCLPDDILSRFSMKTFATPFSHGRTNIEYVTQADRENFESLLTFDHLKKDEIWGKSVVKNRLYDCDPSLYEASVSSGFEFTHHDVIANKDHRESYDRKIDRWLELRRLSYEVFFLYHHRDWPGKNIDKVAEKLRDFQTSFSRDGARCAVVLLDQNVSQAEPRSWQILELSNDLLHAKLVTRQHWSGTDNDVFWARSDNDLLEPALNECIRLLTPAFEAANAEAAAG